MSKSFLRTRICLAALVAAAALPLPAAATDVVLLPDGLMSPTTQGLPLQAFQFLSEQSCAMAPVARPDNSSSGATA